MYHYRTFPRPRFHYLPFSLSPNFIYRTTDSAHACSHKPRSGPKTPGVRQHWLSTRSRRASRVVDPWFGEQPPPALPAAGSGNTSTTVTTEGDAGSKPRVKSVRKKRVPTRAVVAVREDKL